MMEDWRLISPGLYRVICKKLGTEKVVDMRRRLNELRDSMMAPDDGVYEDSLLSGRGFGSHLLIMIGCTFVKISACFSLSRQKNSTTLTRRFFLQKAIEQNRGSHYCELY